MLLVKKDFFAALQMFGQVPCERPVDDVEGLAKVGGDAAQAGLALLGQ